MSFPTLSEVEEKRESYIDCCKIPHQVRNDKKSGGEDINQNICNLTIKIGDKVPAFAGITYVQGIIPSPLTPLPKGEGKAVFELPPLLSGEGKRTYGARG